MSSNVFFLSGRSGQRGVHNGTGLSGAVRDGAGLVGEGSKAPAEKQALWDATMSRNEPEGLCFLLTPCGEVRESVGSFIIETPLVLEHGRGCTRVPRPLSKWPDLDTLGAWLQQAFRDASGNSEKWLPQSAGSVRMWQRTPEEAKMQKRAGQPGTLASQTTQSQTISDNTNTLVVEVSQLCMI